MHPVDSAAAVSWATLTRGAGALCARDARSLAALATACRRSMALVADAWVDASVAAKGWTMVPTATAEEWASGPLPVARFLAVLERLFERTARGVVAAGTPRRLLDALLLRGVRAHIHVGSASSPAAPSRDGNIALVLGAGNVTATPLLDVLDQVFLRGRAVVLKLSPLHRSLRSTFAEALAPLVEAGLLQLVDGDASFARELAHHAGIAAVHLTGSSTTWATLRADPRLQQKQLTAEVGCCTPAILVPGHFEPLELQHIAEQLAAYTASNGGATCIAPRVLLTAASWPQRAEFLHHLAAAMASLPARVPFHAISREHFALATDQEPATAALPPTLRQHASVDEGRRLCAQELFTPVLREMALPGNDLPTFVGNTIRLVQEHCFGSLSAYVFAPPASLRSERAAIDRLIEALPHGTVAINTWTGLGYALGTTPWGVRPGSDLRHGSGWTRNVTGHADVRRVVVEAPLRLRPLPPWLPRHRRAAAMLRCLTHFYLRPSARHLAAIAVHALRS